MGLAENYNQETIILGNRDTAASINVKGKGTEVRLDISEILMAWVMTSVYERMGL
jgi:hypothetical protein